MKRIIFLILLGGIFLSSTMAQSVELTGFYGYMVNTDLKTYYGNFSMDDAANYGGILSVEVSPDVFAEFLYNRTDTDFRYTFDNSTEPMDVSTEYYQLGGLRSMGSGKVKPFAAVSLGAARFYLKESYGQFSEDALWAFATTVGLGAKVFLNDKLGIRVQARMDLPMRAEGFYIGTGGTGGTFVVPVWQFDFTGGLFLRLGGS